jgi:hypothetical protein
MKMISKKQTIIIAISALLLTSCGSTSTKEKVIKVDNVSISGESSKYFKVVPDNYTMQVVEDKIVIPIKLQLNAVYKGNQFEIGNLSLVPLTKSGAAVPNIGLDMHPATPGEWSKIADLLKGDVGKTVTISFEWSYFSNKKIQERIMKETESFEITGADFTGGSDSEKTTAGTNTDNPGSSDWNKMLDDYEAYVDDYIKFYKKAQAGDQTALAEYPEMMQKAVALQKDLQDANNSKSLSTDQISRLMKIQLKMAGTLKN